MAPKEPTKWEIAKPLLEKDYLDGVATDEMRRGVVHKLRPEYEAVPIGNFGQNWNRMKANIGAMKEHATRDKEALAHDRSLYPPDPTRWDQSQAKIYLKEDVDNDFHLHFDPEELWLTCEPRRRFHRQCCN